MDGRGWKSCSYREEVTEIRVCSRKEVALRSYLLELLKKEIGDDGGWVLCVEVGLQDEE